MITDPLPVVRVSVNGSKPQKFFIDTGGVDIMLEPQFARKVGAEISGSMRGSSAGDGGTMDMGMVREIKIGEHTIRSVPFFTLPTATFEALKKDFGDLNLRGVIGTRLLMHFHSTIDYVSGKLILRLRTKGNDRELDILAAQPTVKAIPFRLVGMHMIISPGRLNDRPPALFFVDTGLGGKGFTAPEDYLRRAGVIIDWSKSRSGQGGFHSSRGTDIILDRLSLGWGSQSITVRNVDGVVLKQPPPVFAGQAGVPIRGLISHAFFRRYALTFDFRKMRLLLNRK